MDEQQAVKVILVSLAAFDGSAQMALEIVNQLEPLFVQLQTRPPRLSEAELRQLEAGYNRLIAVLAAERRNLSKQLSELSGPKQKRIVNAYSKHMKSSMKMTF